MKLMSQTINKTGQNTEWKGCTKITDGKTEEDLINDGKISNGKIKTSMKGLVDEFNDKDGQDKAIKKLVDKEKETVKPLTTEQRLETEKEVARHKALHITLKMDLSSVPSKQRRWIEKHLKNNKVLGHSWADGVEYEFTNEYVRSPMVRAHVKEFGLKVVE